MSESVHFIPVGFDFDRLILPISKGELNADRVVLITHEGEPTDKPTDRAAELATDMYEQLSRSFELMGVEPQEKGIEIDSLYDYEEIYAKAYEYIFDELEAGNEVYVNISSMPRTVAFAFATAADSLATEDRIDDARNRVHTYYVGPENYLVVDMIEALEKAEAQLEGSDQFNDLYADISDILERLNESGVTEGTKHEDPMHIEFPSSPGSDLDDFEETILEFLNGKDTIESTSELAERLASEIEEEYDDSFRSRVQYNVGKLEGKGYVNREKDGNRLETSLSTMGRMWAKTH
ncbi:DUF6293 family protein [Natrinema thermotolerans]|uniref:DUF6293 family protein n=1 Tax=Natrinema thermotolerans TaxID=121872 RepID=A0AAF0PA49_9EURY|nr:DUF6293 family protein [Natrinema thermotolerans]QCC60233.1 MarR family transcriptional regulator [Natrinema thermotolerans]QCC61144.1 MarR family transcriptional regulator [Natrinema thermotolerans]WMT07251.1 DUF6293 family protein [Natrinema thermotolerans]